MASRQEVNNSESLVVAQEYEFAINRALYGIVWSLGSPYYVGSLFYPSLALTANMVAER